MIQGAVQPLQHYRHSAEETLQDVQSSNNGLTTSEAEKRLETEGYNELKGKAATPIWKLFLENFKDPMVIVLLIAAAVQIVLGHLIESLIIFLVILLNAVISVVQTKKAESSLDALRQMSAPEAKVIRDGQKKRFPRGISFQVTLSCSMQVIMFRQMAAFWNQAACESTRAC